MKQGSRALVAFAILLAVCWLVPIYLIGISALGPKEAATAWPKSLLPTMKRRVLLSRRELLWRRSCCNAAVLRASYDELLRNSAAAHVSRPFG
jgi:ABC-type glycerol-3-phosphate transport system permease component